LVEQLAAGATSPELLVGLTPSDDATVLRLRPDLALVSTTDFFPPLVDDPDDFGAIAAANACSDVFAMGGEVRLAIAVAVFPDALPATVAADILNAAARTVSEAGGDLAGGHTISGPEPVFGLAVQGTVHPERIWTKGGARPGDQLVLSKPIGTGLVVSAGAADDVAAAVRWMRMLNRDAAQQLRTVGNGRGPSSCTDVTGFGLAGHAWEMAERSDAVLRLELQSVPLHRGALELSSRGVSTGGAGRVEQSLNGKVEAAAGLDPALRALAMDPQTSGGLLAAVDPGAVGALVAQGWSHVGDVAGGGPSVHLR